MLMRKHNQVLLIAKTNVYNTYLYYSMTITKQIIDNIGKVTKGIIT